MVTNFLVVIIPRRLMLDAYNGFLNVLLFLLLLYQGVINRSLMVKYVCMYVYIRGE